MEGQSPPTVLQEDVFDEVHWATEQVKITMRMLCFMHTGTSISAVFLQAIWNV